MKLLIFRLITYTPLVALSILIAFVGYRFMGYRDISIFKEVSGYLYYKSKAEYKLPPSQENFVNNMSNNTVVFLGGSSLVLPDACESNETDSINFPSLLREDFLKHNLRIANFGQCDSDSFQILGTAKHLLNLEVPPKAIIIYTGHNDFSKAIRQVMSQFSLFNFQSILDSMEQRGYSPETIFRFYYFFNNTLTPFTLRIYQLFDSDFLFPKDFEPSHELIFEKLVENLNQLAVLSSKKGVKVFFIPAVGNLLHPPYSNGSEFDKNFLEFAVRNNFDGLLSISDQDNWGNDRRIKSIVYRNLNQFKKMETFSLYEELKKTQDVRVYDKYFTDIFHFSPEGHEFVKNFILKSKIPELIQSTSH